MTLDTSTDPYTWSDEPTLLLRLTHPGRGMYHDLRRRLPYYLSDITDGINYRTLSASIRIFFVNLLPALAFQLDMAHNTEGFFGINEALLSSVLAAFVFSIFSVQPLTIVGVTGLISLFNYTIFDIIKLHDAVTIYPQLMVWVGLWSGVFHILTALFNLCDYMRTITDFSTDTFALYVGTIYIIKGLEELAINFYDAQLLNGFVSALIAVLFTLTILGLEYLRNTTLLRQPIRAFLADYAYPIATIFWSGFTYFPGNLSQVPFQYLPVTTAFKPTIPRPWVVPFWELEAKWIFVALPFGLLTTLLFYYDHNVSSLTAQARKFPLTKPAGFHWDFFLLGCTCVVAGVLNVPLPNGLVPQAPVHTEALTEMEERVRMVVMREEGVARDGEGKWVERRVVEKVTRPVRVVEQRVSHLLMAGMLLVTMTGPLLRVLGLIPRAVLSGVFFVVGFGSVGSNTIVKRLGWLLQEGRFRQPEDPLAKVSKKEVGWFLGFQLVGWVATVAVSQTIGAVAFPVLIVALVPLRWVLFPRWFKREDLEVLDGLTADGEVVCVGLGGVPVLPEVRMVEERQMDLERAEREEQSEEKMEERNSGDQTLRQRNVEGLPTEGDFGEESDDTRVE